MSFIYDDKYSHLAYQVWDPSYVLLPMEDYKDLQSDVDQFEGYRELIEIHPAIAIDVC